MHYSSPFFLKKYLYIFICIIIPSEELMTFYERMIKGLNAINLASYPVYAFRLEMFYISFQNAQRLYMYY